MGKFSFLSSWCCFSSPKEETIVGSLSSSQPSQQLANVRASSATTTDFESFLHTFNDRRELQNLIQFIEELLKIMSGEKNGGESSSTESSYIQDGQKIIELFDKPIGKLPDFQFGTATSTCDNILI
ncbi:hypothetical protein SUGI_0988990 [Cryptomeria japonica]|uniref:uncharacterized protein LOC131029993 n=1 Tax=Cryptomeria japonica TaxID=3369 RepID=UPI00241473D3|nr:uncharacterized protein LOC131029993 [Cryptomeria japonica]GLJ46887.1 hypothetical protein SUGI_0988990 [Cryptomeria japonica]